MHSISHGRDINIFKYKNTDTLHLLQSYSTEVKEPSVKVTRGIRRYI